MSEILPQTKKCTKCGEEKNLFEFYKDKSIKAGYRSDCKSCSFERGRQDRLAKKEHYKEYHRRQYLANPDKAKAQAKKWYEDNKDKHRESCKKYKANHTEKYRESARKSTKKYLAAHPEHKRMWTAKNPSKGAEYDRTRKARLLGVGGIITAKEWEDLKEKYGNKCLACGRDDVKVHLDHVIPISKNGPNLISNAQPLCKSCNSAKHDKTIDYRINYL